jgi:hypothetical protein
VNETVGAFISKDVRHSVNALIPGGDFIVWRDDFTK